MVSWDDALAYSTPKIARVHDWRLGALHYFFSLGVFAYIIGYVCLYSKQYLLLETPDGTVRVGLLPPNACPTDPQPEDCTGYQQPCVINNCELSYCTLGPGGGLSNQHECQYHDHQFAVWPGVEQRGVLATSRVTEQNQQLPTVCPSAPGATLPGPQCYEWVCSADDNQDARCDGLGLVQPDESIYYVAQIEDFTAFIDHTVIAERLGLSYSYSDPQLFNRGIFDRDGNKLDPCDDYNVANGGVCPSGVNLEVRQYLRHSAPPSLCAPDFVRPAV